MAKKRFGDPLDDLVVNKDALKKPSAISRQPSAAVAKRAEAAGAVLKSVGDEQANPAERQVTKDWEANHERLTFHCPKNLIKEIKDEVRRSSRSKSRVIVDAIRAHLQSK
jgi:hypothetical protein